MTRFSGSFGSGQRLSTQDPLMDRIVAAAADVAVYLSSFGTIERVQVGAAFEGESLEDWVGRAWTDTIAADTRDKVQKLLAEADDEGLSRERQVNQLLGGGYQVPVAFRVLSLPDESGYLALGRSLQPMSDLQQQLVETQQALERDYWRLREAETRYRLLFHRSTEALLLVDGTTFEILDANDGAGQALGLAHRDLVGSAFPSIDGLSEASSKALRRYLELGPGGRDDEPSPLLAPARDGREWSLTVSPLSEDPGSALLVQLRQPSGPSSRSGALATEELEALLRTSPDGFVVMNDSGEVIVANRAFRELVQMPPGDEVAGRSLRQWLGRPGADLTVLLTNLERHGEIRLFATTLRSELDVEAAVELSATRIEVHGRPLIGVAIRNVSRRIAGPSLRPRDLSLAMEQLADQVGQVSLKELVADTVGLVEGHFIEAALHLTGGNRTAAAEVLGVSRQSLYTKLRQYDLSVPEPGGGDS